MKLLLTKGWKGQEDLISEHPSEKEIAELLYSLNWQEFNLVRLEKDPQNWIAISGNLDQDGLATVYEEDSTPYMSDESPESVSQILETLKLYLAGDERFKSFGSLGLNSISNQSNESKYDLWKIQNEISKKTENRNRTIATIAAVLIVSLLGSILYLWYIDELRFFGRDTEYAIATVNAAKVKYGLQGRRYHEVKYEFDYNHKHYKGYFRAFKVGQAHKVGDLVKVKFLVEDPSNSKYVATINRES